MFVVRTHIIIRTRALKMSLNVKVLCPKCRDYNLHNCVIDPETGVVSYACSKCKRAQSTDVTSEETGTVFIPNRIPQIEKSIQSVQIKPFIFTFTFTYYFICLFIDYTIN